MGSRKGFSKTVSEWSVQVRITKAKECVEALTHRVQEVLKLHEANKIIQYSDQLSGQIPRSRAANAFKSFQNAMYRQEVIRLLAYWDTAAENAVSIPTAVVLIDDKDVVDALQSATYDAHANRGVRHLNPSDDPDIQQVIDRMAAEHKKEFATKQAALAAKTLKACVEKFGEIQSLQETTSIKNLRDHLAHSLTRTRRETQGNIPPAKFGDEGELLKKTMSLIEDLYCWVNGTSFDISGECADHARRCAEQLWLNCRFEIGQT